MLSGFRTPPRTMSLAPFFNLGRARDNTFSIHDFAFVKSASSSTFNLYKRFWAVSTTHRSSWHFRWSHSYRTFSAFAGSFASSVNNSSCDLRSRLFSMRILLTLWDLTHPSLHVVERLLVRDIVGYGDVVCCFG